MNFLFFEHEGGNKEVSRLAELSVKKNYDKAQYLVGLMCEYGKFVPQDYSQNNDASFGPHHSSVPEDFVEPTPSDFFFLLDDSPPSNYEKALEWYLMAAMQGHKSAIYRFKELGGVFPDINEAKQEEPFVEVELFTADRILNESNESNESLTQVFCSREAERIRQICVDRNIEYLVHFTRVDNLASILENGLMSLENINSSSIDFIQNDTLRLDNQPTTISLSISFPNSKMFYKYRDLDSSKDWVVLLLEPSILWEQACMFCKTNAASASMRYDSNLYTTSKHLEELFENISSERAQLRECDPTDIQAEVLVLNGIPVAKIKKIIFESAASILLASVDSYDIPSSVNSGYFSQRNIFLDRIGGNDEEYSNISFDDDIPF